MEDKGIFWCCVVGIILISVVLVWGSSANEKEKQKQEQLVEQRLEELEGRIDEMEKYLIPRVQTLMYERD